VTPALIQEELKAEGSVEWRFWLLVACILMNKAPGDRARGVLAKMRAQYFSQYAVAVAYPFYLRCVVRTLGLQENRIKSIIALAKEFDRRFNYNTHLGYLISDLPGCGKYASDSWDIFVLERRDVESEDKELRAYLARTAMG
jgi:endonuclease III